MESEARDFLYEAYETEIGGIQVYTNAVKAAQNDELKKEWKKYLASNPTPRAHSSVSPEDARVRSGGGHARS